MTRRCGPSATCWLAALLVVLASLAFLPAADAGKFGDGKLLLRVARNKCKGLGYGAYFSAMNSSGVNPVVEYLMGDFNVTLLVPNDKAWKLYMRSNPTKTQLIQTVSNHVLKGGQYFNSYLKTLPKGTELITANYNQVVVKFSNKNSVDVSFAKRFAKRAAAKIISPGLYGGRTRNIMVHGLDWFIKPY